MSNAGYLVRRTYTELRMPKADASSTNQATGWPPIRFEGPVLNGEKSVEQRQREVAILAGSHSSPHRPDGPLCAAGNTHKPAKPIIIVWKAKK
jgi:hypothetical protein